MAYTHIHPITQTIGVSIGYITSDKVESFLKDDIADSIKYVMDDKSGEITYKTLTSTLNCTHPSDPIVDFEIMMNNFGERELKCGNSKTKDGAPVLAWHLIQSFEGAVRPSLANRLGVELSRELFGKHVVVVSTHTNTDDIHNHILLSAWNLDGKKWNQCNTNYQRIRECSDRLCDKYGLSVIEHTRQQKLVRWNDAEGKTHYFEPTDRKIEMIRKREAGKNTRDDIGSFRNTDAYDEALAKQKISNKDLVKQAIDDLLPDARSYEHLLSMLQEMGIQIKDKTSTGEWREHITFLLPAATRGVRDSAIGEKGEYTREKLTAVIEAQNAVRKGNETAQANKFNLPHYEEYEYGEVDVQAIDEDYRCDRDEFGNYRVVQRGELERDIIHNIKMLDIDLSDKYDTTRLRLLIEEQRQAKKKNKPAWNRDEEIIRQIQENFANLKFMEEKQLYSYNQINGIVKGLWDQYNACLSKIAEAEDMIERMEKAAQAPKIVFECKTRIEQNKGDHVYMIEGYHKDVMMLKAAYAEMKKFNITDNDSLKELRTSIEKHRQHIEILQASLSGISTELSAYNRCVITLARIDTENKRDFSKVIVEHNEVDEFGTQRLDQQNESKPKKKYRGFERG